ncbi:receptor-like protein 47 [Quercus suber]|uniref:Receptor-like protein 47 n=1 Tax=Quercus suber TaxID=58331 RepID=A0AAW0MBJ1_QUESU
MESTVYSTLTRFTAIQTPIEHYNEFITFFRDVHAVLGLGSCNLSDFPEFLRNQDQLEVLELSQNNIHGQIPKWVSNLSTDTLVFLSMSGNSLTGVWEKSLIIYHTR